MLAQPRLDASPSQWKVFSGVSVYWTAGVSWCVTCAPWSDLLCAMVSDFQSIRVSRKLGVSCHPSGCRPVLGVTVDRQREKGRFPSTHWQQLTIELAPQTHARMNSSFLILHKSGTVVGAFVGLILFVALSSAPLLLKLRNERSN